MSYLILDIGLEDAIRNVQFWSTRDRLDLTFQGQISSGAVWSIGNCFVTLRRVTEMVTEFELLRARWEDSRVQSAYDREASDAFTTLARLFEKSGIGTHRDPNREANKTLVTLWGQVAWGEKYAELATLGEAEGKCQIRERNPAATEQEVNQLWADIEERAETAKADKQERERLSSRTTAEAARELLDSLDSPAKNQGCRDVTTQLAETTPIGRGERKATLSNQRVDFILVTALAEERDAVLGKLPGYRKLPPSENDIHTYYEADLSVTLPDSETSTYQAIVMPLMGMGRVNAATATTTAIARWHPRYVVLVGIAGGVAARNIDIGDILIADQIVDYELQKLTPEGPQVRWEVQRADPRLLNACDNFTDQSWQEQVQVERPDRRNPRRHIGPIASGDKVIAFIDVLERYRKVWPKLIGVEMEAAGVAMAAFQSSEGPGFFMVRCVSDLADEQKGSPDVDKWRSYACDAAASFAIAFLKSGPASLSNESAMALESPSTGHKPEQLRRDSLTRLADPRGAVQQKDSVQASCKATTKKGTRCENRTWNGTDYCHVHRRLAIQHGQDVQENPWERFKAWWQTTLRRYWWLAVLVAIIAALFSAAQVYNALTGKPALELLYRSSPTPSPLPKPSPLPALSPTPFTTPASEGEILIIVSEFRDESEAQYLDVPTVVGSAIAQELPIGSNVRVASAHGVTPSNEAEALQVCTAYNASMIVWGRYTDNLIEFDFTSSTHLLTPAAYHGLLIVDESEDDLRVFVSDLGRGPVRWLSLITIGQVLSIRDHYREAAKYFDIALSTLGTWRPEQSQIATTYFVRGFAQYKLGGVDKAIADYSRAISLDPKYMAAYSYRGLAYLEQGRQTLALTDFDQVVALAPQSLGVYLMRGFARQEAGDFQGAISDFDQMIAIDPQHTTGYLMRGFARQEAGDFQGAISDFDRAIVLSPQDSLAYYSRGLAHHQLGNLQAAIADYDQAITLGQGAGAYHNRGLARQQLGDLKGATNDYDQAIALFPDGPDRALAYYDAACAYALLQNANQACTLLERAISLDGKYRDQAGSEEDLMALRNLDCFKALVGDRD